MTHMRTLYRCPCGTWADCSDGGHIYRAAPVEIGADGTLVAAPKVISDEGDSARAMECPTCGYREVVGEVAPW